MNPTPASLTVVVPTYQEVDNIPLLVRRLDEVRTRHGLNLDLLLVDDDSRDGSAEAVQALRLPWVSLMTRTSVRSLSWAVLDGLRAARSDVFVVMDADLSHPPERIPAILSALEHGADIAIGSRFTEGGSTADDWGFLRWFNSRMATMLALPLVRLSDPMSGFFGLRRSTFEAGVDFNPIGYKIMLELIIKCRCSHPVDVPIHFDNRRYGSSKLSLREQVQYLRHCRRLYVHKFGTWSHLVQFLAVGLSGLAVNLAVLTLLLRSGMTRQLAVALAIGVSMMWNFMLNRRFSFAYARHQSITRQFIGFLAACSAGATVNYWVTIGLWGRFAHKQVPALLGVLVGTGFNFAANRFVIFRARHVRV